eukprot:8895607-Pyramimonas_sp.AAC.1
MLSFGRSRPDFSHLQGSALPSAVNAAVHGLSGWTDDLHLGIGFVAGPQTTALHRVLRAALRQVIVPVPSEVFIAAMVRLQQQLIRVMENPNVNLPPMIQELAITVSIAFSLCRLRAMWTGGRRLQQRAVRVSRGLPTFVGSASTTWGR